jgi:DNA polymerase V
MADALALDLVEKGLVAERIVLTVGYDIDNLNGNNTASYDGDVTTDFYGRKVPKHAHGTVALGGFTSSTRVIVDATISLYDRIVDPRLLVRRLNITADNVIPETEIKPEAAAVQLDLFTDVEEQERLHKAEQESLKREKKVQGAIIDIKKKFGKNAILKGMNLEDGATAKDRNSQIGGHKA